MTDIPSSLIGVLYSLASALDGFTTQSLAAELAAAQATTTDTQIVEVAEIHSARAVPFYSQFDDISSPIWQRRGCGIASLAMIINYYQPESTTVDTLLYQGIENNSYIDNVGWIHNDLAVLARSYGVWGTAHDYANLSTEDAFAALAADIKEGPVIASVHYTFDNTNPIPHLVVITDIEGDTVYHNDPASYTGSGTISKAQFLSSWKKRYISFAST